MPMYEFACAECDQTFEKLLNFSQADTQQRCPCCGSQETKRQLSSFAVGGSARGGESFAPPPSSRFT